MEDSMFISWDLERFVTFTAGMRITSNWITWNKIPDAAAMDSVNKNDILTWKRDEADRLSSLLELNQL